MPGMLYTYYLHAGLLYYPNYHYLQKPIWKLMIFCTKIIRFTFSILDMSLTKVVLNLFFVGGSSITDNRARCPAVFLRYFLFQSMGVYSPYFWPWNP